MEEFNTIRATEAEPAAEEVKAEPAAEEVKAEPAAKEVKAKPAAEEVKAESATEEVKAEPAAKKERTMRRTVNHVFRWLLIYNLVNVLISSIVSDFIPDTGLTMILGTVLGTGFVFLCTSRRWKVNPFKQGPKKMTALDFFTLFGIFGISQILTFCTSLITDAIGLQGTTIAMPAMTAAMVIYVAVSGPFIEEIMYRGFSVGSLKSKGTIPAIVLSSMAFGLMHANLSQFVIGMLSGLLLGFVFSEYSIWWAFLIHLINNSIGSILRLLPETSQEPAGYVFYGIYFVFAVFGIVQLIRRRGEVREWFAKPEHHMEKDGLKGILSSFWMWAFIVIYVGIIIVWMVYPELTEIGMNALNRG